LSNGFQNWKDEKETIVLIVGIISVLLHLMVISSVAYNRNDSPDICRFSGGEYILERFCGADSAPLDVCDPAGIVKSSKGGVFRTFPSSGKAYESI
jgi:hypothetical protein